MTVSRVPACAHEGQFGQIGQHGGCSKQAPSARGRGCAGRVPLRERQHMWQLLWSAHEAAQRQMHLTDVPDTRRTCHLGRGGRY